MERIKFPLLMTLFGLAVFLFSPQAQAEIRPGVRAGVYFDAESAFIGGEILTNVTKSWFFNPNVEYIFIDRGDEWTFNFDFHYDFATESPFCVWLGGGPAIIYLNPEGEFRDSETDFGVNLLMGIGFKVGDGSIIPYIQPKVILSDNSEFSLAFGVRF